MTDGKNRPLIPTTVFLAIGLAIGKSISVNFLIPLIILFLFLFSAYALYVLSRKKYASFLIYCSFVFVGIILINYRQALAEKSFVRVNQGKTTEITGIVVQPPGPGGAGNRMLIQVEEKDREKTPGKTGARITVSRGMDRIKNLNPEPGDRLRITGTAYNPQPPSNPYQFNQQEYLKHQNISIIIAYDYKGSIEKIDSTRKFPLQRFAFRVRKQIWNNLSQRIPAPHSQLLMGIMFGRRGDMPEEIVQSFKTVGIMHILAASGLHVGIVMGFFIYIFKLMRIRPRARYLLTIAPVILYSLLAGGSPSIFRASFMACLYLTASAFGKENRPLDSLFFAAFVMLVTEPFNAFQAGFQMSFSAVLGILLFYPIINNRLDKKTEKAGGDKEPGDFPNNCRRWKRAIIQASIVTICAQIFLLPILAYYFNSLSLVSIIGNLLILPFVSILLPAGLAAGFASLFLGQAACFFSVLYYLLKTMTAIADIIAGIPNASIPVPSPGFVFFLFYYSLLLLPAISDKSLFHHRKTIAMGIILTASIFPISSLVKQKQPDRAVFFHTPHNSVILLEKRGFTNMVIIKGKKTGARRDRTQLRWNVIPYLEKRGVYAMESLILWGEFDKIPGDLKELGDRCRIGRIIITGSSPEFQSRIREILPHIDIIIADQEFSISKGKDILHIYPRRSKNLLIKKNKTNSVVFTGKPEPAVQWSGDPVLWVYTNKKIDSPEEPFPENNRAVGLFDSSPGIPSPAGKRALIYDLSTAIPREIEWK